MKNPVYANETAQEYVGRMALALQVAALPEGKEGGILLNHVEYDRHKDALAPYNPWRAQVKEND